MFSSLRARPFYLKTMSTKKKGMLTVSIEYARHLRKWGKKFFWKGERQAAKELIITNKKEYENRN